MVGTRARVKIALRSAAVDRRRRKSGQEIPGADQENPRSQSAHFIGRLLVQLAVLASLKRGLGPLWRRWRRLPPVRTRAGTKTTLVRTDKIPSLSHWQRLARQAEFNPAKMASLCGVSERQLQRIFKKHLGSSPSKWLRALQCRLAEELVVQGYSNKAVAAALKFSTDAHFCREFKKIFGVPPQRFASASRKRGASMGLAKVDAGPAAEGAR